MVWLWKFFAFITACFKDEKSNIVLKVCISCVIIEIQWSPSCHKSLESRLHLLVKVEKRYCGIKKGLTKVIIFHLTLIYLSGLLLQGVDKNLVLLGQFIETITDSALCHSSINFLGESCYYGLASLRSVSAWNAMCCSDLQLQMSSATIPVITI